MPVGGYIYPQCGTAEWQQDKHRMVLGDGDDDYAPMVSLDIVAHEYGHYLLHNNFKINSDASPITFPSVWDTKAIHEGVSDLFSVLIRRYEGNYDWKVAHTALINPSYMYAPRNIAYPDSSRPAQAIYYNDTTAGWNPTYSRYNRAGIVSKWFYLMTNGGTGVKYATDGITVQPLGIDTAEMILLKGLDTLKKSIITVPTYEQFCQAMVDGAQTISCNARLQCLRAWKAVGLGLTIPGGKTDQTQDEILCFVDLRMSDNNWDTGQEPNYSAGVDSDGNGWTLDSATDWEDIWHSPDLWNCPNNDNCIADSEGVPYEIYTNKMGFTVHNAHPDIISDPALLHLYYTMGSTGEMWDFTWIDNFYFNTLGTGTCRVGDELVNSPVTIPAIDPLSEHTAWVTWSPPNFTNPDIVQYVDPSTCGLNPETDPADGIPKYEICLLARLESAQDPIVGESNPGPIRDNIFNSNNIVTNNYFMPIAGEGAGGGQPPIIAGHPSVVLVANNNTEIKYLDVLFDKWSAGSTEALYNILEISFVLSSELWAKWESTGKQGEGVEIIDEREVKITNMETAKLLNIPFNAKEFQPMAVKVTFLTSSGKRETANLLSLPDEFGFRITHQSSDNSPINPASDCLFVVKDIRNRTQSAQLGNNNLFCSPNPFNNNLTVRFYVEQPETVSLALYDMQGHLVKMVLQNHPFNIGEHQFSIDNSNLSAGVYVCHLTSPNRQISQKVVKIK